MSLAVIGPVEQRLLTGDACVSALLRAGFKIKHRGTGLVLLSRGTAVVMVPDVGVLEPFMLRAILRSAGITEAELEAHLAHVPTRSGIFTRPRSDDTLTAAADDDRTVEAAANRK